MKIMYYCLLFFLSSLVSRSTLSEISHKSRFNSSSDGFFQLLIDLRQKGYQNVGIKIQGM